jgi:cysteinyl-tRNA synthetase
VALLTFVTAKHHYRSPIDFCDRLFHETLNQLCEFHDLIGAPASAAQGRDTPLDADFQAEMDEDLNSPRAMQVLMTALREASARPPSERAQVAAKVRQLSEILGIYQPSQSAADVRAACLRFQTDFLKRPLLTVDSVEALLMQRTAARQRRDWKESDRIRDELLISGVTVCDSPTGATTWQFTVLPT